MKILIADDHALFRDGLKLNLQQISDQLQILEAESYTSAELLLREQKDVNLVIVDLDMPDMRWEEGLSMLQNASSKAKVVVISAIEDIKIIKNVMQQGIDGYIPKRSEPKIISAAVKLVLDGGQYVPPLVLGGKSGSQNAEDTSDKKLTPRQYEALKYIAQGLSNKQIAHEMGVSEATVKLHINAMLKILKATNRTQALVNAQKLELL